MKGSAGMIDFEFVALCICAVFGWTLPDVFALTWPQFFKVILEVRRIQYQRAKNEVYFGVCAAIGGGEAETDLLNEAGSFMLGEEMPELSYTEEELRIAEERMKAIIEARKKQAELTKPEADNV